jgi:hypothetical protein
MLIRGQEHAFTSLHKALDDLGHRVRLSGAWHAENKSVVASNEYLFDRVALIDVEVARDGDVVGMKAHGRSVKLWRLEVYDEAPSFDVTVDVEELREVVPDSSHASSEFVLIDTIPNRTRGVGPSAMFNRVIQSDDGMKGCEFEDEAPCEGNHAIVDRDCHRFAHRDMAGESSSIRAMKPVDVAAHLGVKRSVARIETWIDDHVGPTSTKTLSLGSRHGPKLLPEPDQLPFLEGDEMFPFLEKG